MAFPKARIVSVAIGVLVLILVTICCAIPSWIVVSLTVPLLGTPGMAQFGLWKTCTGIIWHETCTDYGPPISSDSNLRGIQAMTVISCLLTYFGVLVLLLLGFGAKFIPFLKNEKMKPKIRLAVGVGLLLAGILLISSVCWFSQKIKNFSKVTFPGGVSIEAEKGAGFIVGLIAGVQLIVIGGLLCYFRKNDIP